jgi:predicted Zn-dependent peptidase
MRGLAITQENLKNQQEVVKNEVKVNVLNEPYGGFPWLDMPQVANTNWHNAHNFYGDLKDLDAATLDDVKSFFRTFYSPGNAALVVVGDFDSAEALGFVHKYFEGIPSAGKPPAPDLTEPRQEKEKRTSKPDPLATRPALAFGYHMPARNTPEYYAMGLLDQILLQGDDSRLRQVLVKEKGYAGTVEGGINLLGNMFNYNGPMLWIAYLFHDSNVRPEDILAAADQVFTDVRSKPITQAEFDRSLVKLRSGLYDALSDMFGFGRADLLASFALFDDNPARINGLEADFRKLTPALLQKTAEEYLRPTNRTILTIEPKAAAGKESL